MKATLIFAVICIACLIHVSFAKVLITSAHSETNKDYLTMSIVVNNKTDGTFVDLTVDMLKDLDGKILMSFEIFKKIGGEYKSLVVMTVRNICEVLAEKMDTPAIDMAVQMLSQFGSVPASCPIQKGHFSVKDFKIPDFLISPFVTGGHYQMIYQAVDHNGDSPIVVSTTTIHVTMVKDANSNPENIQKLLKLLSQ